MLEGCYYLHENGSLICKPNGDVDLTSTFVKRCWPCAHIGASPDTFVAFLEQAAKLGANKKDIDRLAEHNNISKYREDWNSKWYTEIFGE